MKHEKKTKSKRRMKKKSNVIKTGTSKTVHFKPTNHMPVPERLEDSFEMTLCGYIPAGNLNGTEWSAVGSPWLGTQVSSIIPSTGQGPLYTGSTATGIISNIQVLSGGLATTSTPIGFTQFFNKTAGGAALYQQVHVVKCHYNFTFQPTNSADNFFICVVPDNISDTGTTSNFANISTAMSRPQSRWKLISAGQPHSTNTLKGTIDVPKFFGKTRAEYLDDIAYSTINNDIGGSIANPTSYYNCGMQIFAAVAGNSTLANKVTCIMSWKWDVVFSLPAAATLST